MKKILSYALAGTFAILAMTNLGVNTAMAVTCPKGTMYADQQKNTLADCNMNNSNMESDLWGTVHKILNLVVGVLGVVAVGVVILGGITLATSQGDVAKVTRGKNTIMYGVIGLIVALLAFAIVNFVLMGVFGTPKTGEGGAKS